jgi:hypothetical protein
LASAGERIALPITAGTAAPAIENRKALRTSALGPFFNRIAI